jgi:hypothetical protein
MLFAKCLNIFNCRLHKGMSTNNSRMQTFNTINKVWSSGLFKVETFMIHLFLCEYFTILNTSTIFVGKIQLDVNCQLINLAKHNIFSCTLHFFMFLSLFKLFNYGSIQLNFFAKWSLLRLSPSIEHPYYINY